MSDWWAADPVAAPVQAPAVTAAPAGNWWESDPAASAQPSGFFAKVADRFQNPPNELSVIGEAGKLYRAVKDAATGVVNIASGETPMAAPGLRREDVTDTPGSAQPIDSSIPAVAKGALLLTPGSAALKVGAVAPTVAELKASAKAGFQSPEVAALQLRPDVLPRLSQTIQAHLDEMGIDGTVAEKTFKVLKRLEAPPPEGAVVTGNNLVNARKVFGLVAGSPDGTERLAATHAKSVIDDFMSQLPTKDVISGDPQRVSAILSNARGDYSAAMDATLIDKKQIRAELRAASTNSGMNVANTMRQRLADVLTNDKTRALYTPDQQAAMEKIVRGSIPSNAVRMAGNVLGGGGGIGTAAIGALGGYELGPLGYSLPLAGYALKTLSNRMTEGKVAQLSEMIRSDSPLARQIGIPLHRWGSAVQAVQNAPTARNVAMFTIASRNLSNNLASVGVKLPPSDMIRAIQGPMNAPADNEQPKANRIGNQ